MTHHNKKRNSGFLFEILSRELAKACYDNLEDKKVELLKLIKETFGNTSTELAKDLRLFQNLSCKNVKKTIAERLLQETKKLRNSIDQNKLWKEQDALLEKINKVISKEAFSNFVPNYRRLATIAQIFNVKTSIKDRVMLEENLINYMSGKATTKEQLQPVNKLAYSLFLKKYNEHYGNKLLKEQKELLQHYIMSFSEGVAEFHYYLNETVGKLKKAITESLETKEIKEDASMIDKTKQVLKLIEGMKQRKIDEKMLKDIMAIQELVSEVKGEIEKDAVN